MKFSISNLQQVCIVYLTIWTLSPPLGYHWVFRVLCGIALLFWFMLEAKHEKNVFNNPSLSLVATCFYLIYVLIINVFFDASQDLVDSFQLLIFFMFFVIFEAHRLRGLNKIKSVLFTVLLICPIWNIITIVHLLDNPELSRHISRSDDLAKSLSMKGIVGYGYIYATVIMQPVFIYLSFKMKLFNKLKSLFLLKFPRYNLMEFLLLLNMISSIALILKAAYSFALIQMVISFILLIVYSKYNVYRKVMLAASLGGFLIFVPYVLTYHINDILIATHGTNYWAKARDVNKSLEKGRAVGMVLLRIERYERSLKLFFKNPFFGVIQRRDIGKHSMILDNLAQYGLTVGWLFIFLIIRVPMRYHKNNLYPTLAFAVLVALSLYALSNNIVAATGPALFMVFPLGVEILRSYEQKLGKSRLIVT